MLTDMEFDQKIQQEADRLELVHVALNALHRGLCDDDSGKLSTTSYYVIKIATHTVSFAEAARSNKKIHKVAGCLV